MIHPLLIPPCTHIHMYINMTGGDNGGHHGGRDHFNRGKQTDETSCLSPNPSSMMLQMIDKYQPKLYVLVN